MTRFGDRELDLLIGRAENFADTLASKGFSKRMRRAFAPSPSMAQRPPLSSKIVGHYLDLVGAF